MDKPMEEQDEVFTLAERIRAVLPDGHASEKRMFGGVTFLVKGNMLCCAFRHGLMLRVGTDAESAALTQPFVRRLSETRKMPGFVFIESKGIVEKTALSHWIGAARAYVDRLPATASKKPPAKTSGKTARKTSGENAIKSTRRPTRKR
jgi:hypothetical protein